MSEKNYGNNSQLAELMKYISDNMKVPILGAGGGFAPIGTINFFDASIAPQGWLACDGSVVNIADYPDLATYYASVHGSANFYGGNGTTTFAVPDLRGEFLRGTGTNSHANQGDGASVGVHQDATEHLDSWTYNQRSAYYRGSSNVNQRVNNKDSSVNSITGAFGLGSNDLFTDSGYVNYTSRPTNTSFLICVKATLSDANLDAYTVYSPIEHQKGWWREEIDGVLKQKPIYEKTLSVGDLSTGTYNYTHNISNIDRVVSYLGTAIRGDGAQFVFPSINMASSNYNASVYCIYTSSVVVFSVGSGASGNDRFQDCKLTICYTKTTDQWQTV